MNILILMPIDEQHAWVSNNLMLSITPEKQKFVLPLAGYADYLVQTKMAKNWEEAALKSIISSEVFMTQPMEHHVVIGNASKNFNFDLIVSFDDTDQFEPYKDKFLDLLKSRDDKNNEIIKKLNKLYSSENSKMVMINSAATGEFISKYLDTEVKIDEHLGERLKSQIKFWKIG